MFDANRRQSIYVVTFTPGSSDTCRNLWFRDRLPVWNPGSAVSGPLTGSFVTLFGQFQSKTGITP